jgi:hypothetical protein
MGATWATTLEITVAKESAWSTPLSLWLVCGTTALVGGHGTPNWDSAAAATSGCLTYTWTNPSKVS